jgi:GNAT superfamily N-acetyltransferase
VATASGIRAAHPGDIASMRAILAGHGEDAPPLPGHPDVLGPYLRHLVDHHRVLVVDEGEGTAEPGDGMVGFGAVLDTGRCRMLSDLFVRKDRLGQGLGRALLAELFEDEPRRATFASADPRALPVYVRAGMTPLWINLYLVGSPVRLPAPGPGVETRAASADECSALELAWTGADRSVDHTFLAGTGEADVFVVELDGSPVAFGYARAKQVSEARQLDRLLVRPGAEPRGPMLAALERAAGDGRVEACILGPNPILPLLLEAGFQVNDHDQYLASDPSIVDPARLLPNAGLL